MVCTNCGLWEHRCKCEKRPGKCVVHPPPYKIDSQINFMSAQQLVEFINIKKQYIGAFLTYADGSSRPIEATEIDELHARHEELKLANKRLEFLQDTDTINGIPIEDLAKRAYEIVKHPMFGKFPALPKPEEPEEETKKPLKRERKIVFQDE